MAFWWEVGEGKELGDTFNEEEGTWEPRAQHRVLAALQDFGASGLMVHKIRKLGPSF